jgi:hypothetical protein
VDQYYARGNQNQGDFEAGLVRLEGLSVSNQANEETILSGQISDQAALLRLLNRIHGLEPTTAFFFTVRQSGITKQRIVNNPIQVNAQ